MTKITTPVTDSTKGRQRDKGKNNGGSADAKGASQRGSRCARPRESLRSSAPTSSTRSSAAGGDTTAKLEAAKWLDRTTRAGVDGLRREFMALRKYEPPGVTVKAFKAHNNRNRYKDVKCADNSRVKLHGSPDYIHASHVTLGLRHKIILTQAPTDRTVTDFWRMVWQSGSHMVVMLCEQFESGGRFKCPQYWPTEPSKPLTVGAYKIVFDRREVVSLNDNQVVHKTVLMVTRGTGGNAKLNESDGGTGEGLQRTVEQYRWIGWPEKGVPISSAAALYVRQRLRANDDNDGGPVIIHCSSGVGRAGTLALFALAAERLEAGQPLHMPDLLQQARVQRLHIVQTEQQYLYVHRCLIEHVTMATDAPDLLMPCNPAAIKFLCEYEMYGIKKNMDAMEPPSSKTE